MRRKGIVKEFLEYVVRGLVDAPEEVAVTELPRERSVVYRIRVRAGDVGKVIGTHGKTIASMRSLLNAAASRHRRKAYIEIIEANEIAEENPPEGRVVGGGAEAG